MGVDVLFFCAGCFVDAETQFGSENSAFAAVALEFDGYDNGIESAELISGQRYPADASEV